ncbi:MAG TPA: efflux RND transporter permease subunit [Sedimentisphaerales bacterium]|nr:efflux RND transporter permease subunit [Sedimentisphaerales bacterium]HRS11540.1 efflux RND transporter permease subunit [Sedimentisphaerales bacterium]HRV48208.1 efflux RND transporter permease subunit [Sedimentisphaerales bacterium]
MDERQRDIRAGASLLDRVIRFCLENKLVVALVVLLVVGWGLLVAPFDWDLAGAPRSPVPVDAIPDIGENQQIVFTEWMGRSPQDVEDQVTYPLTVSLMGLPGVKTVRSYSFFGFSSIYVIFQERVDFYWSRSRVLEKLNSLPAGTLPEGVQPALGPDATGLGQVFWYTLEGRDPNGNPAGGWDLDELRTIQDWYVRYALLGAEGVSEVASVGGFVREYQIDVDPDAMRAYGVGLEDIVKAVKGSNIDVGARTIEINKVEYVIRGLGFVKRLSDIEQTVIKVNDNVPIYVKDIAKVSTGPALRRGALDKSGAEAVGGVVVVRYGYNPLAAIQHVKEKIDELAPGLPEKTLADGTVSKVTIVPFYDRTGLIYETLGTLDTALTEEVLVTIIVVIVMVMHLHSSVLISALLPLAILMCFIAMKQFGVDANIVALSGIAIAIGTMVDMGIVICENILRRLDEAQEGDNALEVVYQASSEVGSAVVTAVATTIVSFLPVFTMTGAEGKLFKPLAFTKTFALLASIIVALTIIPPAAHILFTRKTVRSRIKRYVLGVILLGLAVAAGILFAWWIGAIIAAVGLYHLTQDRLPARARSAMPLLANALAVVVVGIVLTQHWLPVGPVEGFARNFAFVALLVGGLLLFFRIFQHFYPVILGWCLDHKIAFLSLPLLILVLGLMVWQGVAKVLFFVPEPLRQNRAWTAAAQVFPGLGREFMPALDEGSFLYMPTTMPHASIGEVLDVIAKQDMAFQAIPEIDSVVGKLGRVDSPLDPAPISMIETVINYKTEYVTDADGHRLRFKFDRANGEYVRDAQGNLIPDPDGRPYRQWRDHIRSPDDIWNEIVKAGEIPGTTSAPKLQPIEARIVMLQSGMRAPMGVKVKGPDLATIEKVALEIERFLKEVPGVEPAAVIADRVVGKPYLEIDIDRERIARYGISVQRVQDVIEVAIGGKRLTTTVEGRQRYGVRIRYLRELRDQIDTLEKILVPAPDGSQIPLIQLAEIHYVRGPQAIKSEDLFLTAYVVFDRRPQYAEVDVIEQCRQYLQSKIDSGQFRVPVGVHYEFAGTYENQIRATQTLTVVVPLALFIIFLILYLQFKRVSTTALVFSGILVAWAGGFLMIWLYARPWFLDFSIFGANMRDLFQVHPINLSVAIWVGFLALFGIASDDGVVMCTYLEQSFRNRPTETVPQIRKAVVAAGSRRVRPCLMTTATTILALIPVLTSTGRGSDIMVPMAIPSFGGMTIEVLTMLIVPVLYSALEEAKARRAARR